MASSLILHKRIFTTTAKAKALRTYVEPLITKSKTDNTHSRRTVFSYLKDKHAVSELFREVADKVGERPGGYTRILKTGNRLGDNAEMCFIELVDFNENMLQETQKKSSRSRRRRRGGGKKKPAEVPAGATEQESASEQAKSTTETASGAAQVAEEVAETAEQESTEEVQEEKKESPEEPKAEQKESEQTEEKKDEGSQKDADSKEEK